MKSLRVPVRLQEKLDDGGSEDLVTMFAEAHRITMERFERRLDERFEHHTSMLTERFARRLADLRADLIKWSFVFWIGQMMGVITAFAAILALMLPGR